MRGHEQAPPIKRKPRWPSIAAVYDPMKSHIINDTPLTRAVANPRREFWVDRYHDGTIAMMIVTNDSNQINESEIATAKTVFSQNVNNEIHRTHRTHPITRG